MPICWVTILTISWLLSSICCLKAAKELLVNDCWGVGKGTLTLGVYNGGNCACKFWEKFDAPVCRSNIEVVGLPGGIDIWLTVPKFQTP